MSFAKLKKNRGSVEKLIAAVESTKSGGGSYEDEKEWKPTVDKAGNGYAVIRFLPAAEGQDLPWVQYWDHGFKGDTGKWYFEKSLTTIGQNDPVSEMNSQLWNSGRDEDKELARARKRRLHYVSNIMVIADSANPENEGKVFKYQYGKKIYDKLIEVMQPEFQDEDPLNPFDFWEGADFKLKIRNVAGYRNYDKSEFDKPSALLDGDDAKLEEVYNNLHDLSEYTDPGTFKSYAELKKKLYDVIGEETVASTLDTATQVDLNETTDDPLADDLPFDFPDNTEIPGDTKDDDELGYFAKLAQS